MLPTEAHDHSDHPWNRTIGPRTVDDVPTINVAGLLQALAAVRLGDDHIANTDEFPMHPILL